MSLNLKDALATLGITDVGDHPPKMKFIQKRFYQLSLIHHPDRPGGDNLIQQKISEAFTFLGDYIINNYEIKDDIEEETARQLYKGFNLNNIKENIYSFTINIDNNLSSLWDVVLSEHYGPPVDRNVNGKHWKHHDYSDDNSNTGDISIGKWHIPKKDKQSKINIQSNCPGNILPAHFVSFLFPKLLEEVKIKAGTKNLPPPNSCQAEFACKNCDHRAKTKSQLNAHVKKSHKVKPSPLAVTNTTLREDSKKKPQKFVIHPPLNVLPPTPTSLKCHICECVFYKEDYLREHEATVHRNTSIPHSSTSVNLECILCGKNLPNQEALNAHVKKHHEVKCSNCDSVFYDQYDLDLHILSTHNPVTTTPVSRNSHVIKLEEKTSLDRLASICVLENFANAIPNLHQCKVCGFSARDEAHLKIHDVRNHASSQIKKPLLQCEFCPFTTSTNLQLHKHTSTNHAKIRCDQCLFTTSSQFTLDLHIVQEHDPSKSTSCPPPLYPCNLCGITFNLEEDLKNHILRRHVPVPDPHSPYQQVTPTTHPQSHFQMNDTLARILEEQLDMAQTLKQFKDSVNAQLHVVQEDQKDLRKAIDKLSSDSAQLNGSTSFDLKILESNLQHHISNLSSFMHKSPPNGTPLPPPVTSLTTSDPKRKSLEDPVSSCVPTMVRPPPIPSPTTSSQPSPTPPSTSSPESLPPQKRGRLKTSLRPKVLFIADSIGSTADIRHLEEATNTLIHVEKAYGAAYKVDARYPNKNFTSASMNAPSRRPYSYAVLQGFSTDITNLDTSAASNSELFRQEVTITALNLLTAAKTILMRNSNIKKVLILEATPRFDLKTCDPLGLKKKLSEYGNMILKQELDKSEMKDKIFVAPHSLPKHFQENIYGHPLNPRFDGIHLNGPDGSNHYTRSLCNILQCFIPEFSRESHNHDIPRFHPPSSPESTIPSCSRMLPTTSYSRTSNKPDSVVIDIDVDTAPSSKESVDHHVPFYTIPTHNYFTVLGN